MAWRTAIRALATTVLLTLTLEPVRVHAQATSAGGFGGDDGSGAPEDGAGSPSPGPRSFDSPEDAIRFAENSFVYGDYPDVVVTLEPLLVPSAPPLDTTTLVRAFTLLGTAAHFEGLDELADRAFLELLIIDPRFRLDPLLYPPLVIARFDGVRESNSELIEALIAEETSASTVYIEQTIREQSLLVSMLPFGYGFFASDRDATGLGYLIAEGLLGASMLSLYLSNEIARGPRGFYEHADRARNRQSAQYVMAGAFSALVLANAIHGAADHGRTRRVEYRTLTEPPPELRRDESRGRGRWSFSFHPIFTSH